MPRISSEYLVALAMAAVMTVLGAVWVANTVGGSLHHSAQMIAQATGSN